AWLLAGDPSVRWQVLSDLTHAAPSQITEQRGLVAKEGWGAALLSNQGADGLWANALYSPKWTSTTYTLLLLERLGLETGNPQALAGCERLWTDAHFYDGGLNLAKTIREPEICITAMMILLAQSFGFEEPRLQGTVEWLVSEQLEDGGWNCETIRSGSRHGSFHTSISVLEALLAYKKAGGNINVDQALETGREFFLRHRLYKSHHTGEVANPAFARFPFPPQWHFDVMRGLEHFRAAGAERDERLNDAIEVVRRARRSDGAWPVYRSYPGRYWFKMETRGPSRWSTLRALRILDWWDRRD
ncbi:MAG: hypothetical protein ACR2NL_09700, partial [Acidimicrobiia bacterium]